MIQGAFLVLFCKPSCKVLVVKEIDEKPEWSKEKGQLSVPGGTLELGEDLLAGLIREIYEETGVDLLGKCLPLYRHNYSIVGKSGTPALIHIFYAEVTKELAVTKENAEWVKLESLRTPGVETLRPLITKEALELVFTS